MSEIGHGMIFERDGDFCRRIVRAMRPNDQGDGDINVLVLVKGRERYGFLYDDEHRADTLRMLGRHASHPELSFSWYDATVLSQKIRDEERRTNEKREAELGKRRWNW
jgi:hypothetical protein